jgi:hypothetical protein
MRSDDEIVDLVIAAESLFLGGKDPREMRFRLSLHAATFVELEDVSAKELAIFMRRAYDARSSVGVDPVSLTP